jgi:hypothetical protein
MDINGPNYEIHRNSHPPWFSKGTVSWDGMTPTHFWEFIGDGGIGLTNQEVFQGL